MVRTLPLASLLISLACFPAPAQEPIETDLDEQVEVNLVLIDAVVVDGKGRTVGGLTQDDFRLTVRGRAQQIDTFDATCPDGPMDEPDAMKQAGRRPSLPAPAQPRRMVLAVDYYHIPLQERYETMQQLKAMVAYNKTDGEQVMIVALANGLRIEQRFSSDPDFALATLDRMEHDKSLWAREFGGISSRSFFEDLEVLMDVLSFLDGSKEVVLVSGHQGNASDFDLWYKDLAGKAGLARAAFYPVDVFGLGGPAGGSRALARLANESGGRSTHGTDDFTLAYARAQQAGACRYALGFYVDGDISRKSMKLRVDVEGRGRRVRAVEWFRNQTEEERRESKLRAAFALPGAFDNPLVRLAVYPVRPINAGEWQTVAILQFPLHVGDRTVQIDAAATLARGGVIRRRFQSVFPVTGAAGLEGGDRRVTLMFQGELRPASYVLTSLLSPRLENEMVFSTTASFAIPEVPEGVFVTGPFLARAVPDGLLLRGDEGEFKPIDPGSAPAAALGDDTSFERLVVHRLETSERLLASWSVCTADKKWKAPDGAMIVRELIPRAETGARHRFEAVPLDLPTKGKARCQNGIESLELAGIDPDRYRVRVSLQDAAGEELALGVAPLLIE